MGKIQKEKQKWFRKILNLFCSDPRILYDDPEYDRLYRNCNRILKKADTFLSGRNDVNEESIIVFKHFLAAIYIFYEKNTNGMVLSKSLTPSCFIKHCLHNPITQSKGEKSYNTSVSNEELSFFLTFFRSDSYVSEMLPTPVHNDKQAKLEELIKNEKLDSRERFMALIDLIF